MDAGSESPVVNHMLLQYIGPQYIAAEKTEELLGSVRPEIYLDGEDAVMKAIELSACNVFGAADFKMIEIVGCAFTRMCIPNDWNLQDQLIGLKADLDCMVIVDEFLKQLIEVTVAGSANLIACETLAGSVDDIKGLRCYSKFIEPTLGAVYTDDGCKMGFNPFLDVTISSCSFTNRDLGLDSKTIFTTLLLSMRQVCHLLPHSVLGISSVSQMLEFTVISLSLAVGKGKFSEFRHQLFPDSFALGLCVVEVDVDTERGAITVRTRGQLSESDSALLSAAMCAISGAGIKVDLAGDYDFESLPPSVLVDAIRTAGDLCNPYRGYQVSSYLIDAFLEAYVVVQCSINAESVRVQYLLACCQEILDTIDELIDRPTLEDIVGRLRLLDASISVDSPTVQAVVHLGPGADSLMLATTEEIDAWNMSPQSSCTERTPKLRQGRGVSIRPAARDSIFVKERGNLRAGRIMNRRNEFYFQSVFDSKALVSCLIPVKEIGAASVRIVPYTEEEMNRRNGVLPALLSGAYGADAALWALCRIIYGGLASLSEPLPCYLQGAAVPLSAEGIRINCLLSSELMGMLSVIMCDGHVYLDREGDLDPLEITLKSGVYRGKPTKVDLSKGKVARLKFPKAMGGV